jgi:uncharacterized membrane protein
MSPERVPEPASQREFDYERTVALSDGVFAIALTILVLTISFPTLTGAGRSRLGAELEHRAPQLAAYALSFAVLAFLWLRHHAFFRTLKRIDLTLSVLNLTYLALIAFLPYPTRLLGVYGDRAISVVAYATTNVLIGLISTSMRLHAARAGLSEWPSADVWVWQITAPAVFLLSIPLALLSPTAAKWSWLLLVLVPLLARKASRT